MSTSQTRRHSVEADQNKLKIIIIIIKNHKSKGRKQHKAKITLRIKHRARTQYNAKMHRNAKNTQQR